MVTKLYEHCCRVIPAAVAVAVALAGVVLAGCEASLNGADLARARAAREYECPKKSIRVKWLSEGPRDYQIYKVAACGTVVTYACDADSESCVKEGDERR